MKIALFGSSLVSAYWNGAATYYRGILRALAARGHQITFYEPDAFDRQAHRDIPDPEWARVIIYPGEGVAGVQRALRVARDADMIIKASGIGVFDEYLARAVFDLKRPNNMVAFWDVEAPATLDRVQRHADDPFRPLISRYDLILTCGGGAPVVQAYEALGARSCAVIGHALDPETHHPASADPSFLADMSFLGNRLPEGEARVDELLLDAAARRPDRRFLIGGSGWHDKPMPANVRHAGHVYSRDHNAFHCSARAVLSISRGGTARYGLSPAARVFEAAGAGACVITDDAEGLEQFLEPDREILVARSGAEVAAMLDDLTPDRARAIGQAALKRLLAEHTYDHRAATLEAWLDARTASAKRT
ncbi:MAG: glycosyltransferase [Candidatus Sericytochromatia bacterium]